MAIPGFQEMMLPVLRLLSDGEEHRSKELSEPVADIFSLTEEEREELVPSGVQRKLANRIHWALGYLMRAGLIERRRRGVYRITDSGRRLLAAPPERLDVAYFKEHYGVAPDWGKSREDSTAPERSPGALNDTTTPEAESTPEETLQSAYQQIREGLVEELLEQLMQVPPSRFERIVIALLVAMGYGGSQRDAAQAVGRSGDGGIDGIIKEDRLGLDCVYIQAKRYTQQSVGRPDVQSFVGALTGQRARKGVFLTTSTFTADARQYVAHLDTRVVLIDGRQLAEYMIDHDIGVTTSETYEVKRLDADFFDEEG